MKRRLEHKVHRWVDFSGVSYRYPSTRRANAARRALAARFLVEELHQIGGRGSRRVALRQDHDRRRADEAAVGLQRVEVEGDVALRGGQDAARGAARQVGIELVAVEHAAA